MLLSDNVIKWLSRKYQPGVWAASSCVTILLPCSHTAASKLDCSRVLEEFQLYSRV